MKAVLSNKDADEAKLWGLKSEANIFSSILHTVAEANLSAQRKARSISPANFTSEVFADILSDILENVTYDRPEGRYGHAAESIHGETIQ